MRFCDVDGRPRRLYLVRRQARALARCNDARADAFAALRSRGVRGCARVQDRGRNGDLSPGGTYAAYVQFGPNLPDADSVREGAVDGRATRSRARQQTRVMLSAADRVLRVGKDGR